MANVTVDGASGAAIKSLNPLLDKRIVAAALASDLDRLTRRFAGAKFATVTDVDFMASEGYVLATIGTQEARVLCSTSASLSVGQEILVRRVSADANSAWEYSGGGGSGDTATEYGLCFADPASNTTGAVYVNWGGTITDIQTTGTGTAALTVGGVSVGEGDSISAGSWLVATISGGSGTYFSVAVIVA